MVGDESDSEREKVRERRKKKRWIINTDCDDDVLIAEISIYESMDIIQYFATKKPTKKTDSMNRKNVSIIWSHRIESIMAN